MKNLLHKLSFLFLFFCALQSNLFAQTGTWTKVTSNAPDYNMGVCLLMTDGTVICKDDQGAGTGTGWDKLTPDANGSYVNGTWSRIASMNNDRLFFSSQVLPSGKVYVAGGEYGAGTSAGEVYDPVADTWTNCGAIPNGWKIYDGNSEILYNGVVLEGPQIGANSSYDILQWSPSTLNYTTEADAPLNHDEAAWLKLPDSSVLYVGINSQNTCRYIPQTNTWISDASTPSNIYDQYGEEAGCAIMLPNGKAIFFGSTQYNAIYTPTGHATPGTWAAAANFPVISGAQVGQIDAPGAMMVNGHILLGVSPGNTSYSDQFRNPIWFIEYDYTTNAFTQVTSVIPGLGADSVAGVPGNFAQFLNLPDGTILMSICQENISNEYWVYTPSGNPIAAGKPTINTIIPDGCPNYLITGKLFNGISEGSGFGDDWQMETNYPLVRLTDVSGKVFYAKTTNWNRIGAIQTDSLEDTAEFTVPAGLTPGTTYSLVVTVNGFASNPTLFTTLGASVASNTNPLCNGGAGSATAGTPVGGFTPYTYQWTPGGNTNAIASGLSAGNYTLTVTDKNGCTATAKTTITQPAALTASITKTNVRCNGGNNGSLSASPSGGVSPYTYSWSGGGSSATKSGLTAGNYTLTLTDKNGCTATVLASVTQPATAPSVTIASHTNVSPCFGGATASATANPATNGVGPYTYSWAPSGGTSLTAFNLTAGNYTITATDNNGCTATATVTITQPAGMSIVKDSMNVNSTNACNGEASVNVSGGQSPYTYSWSPGGGTNDTISGKCAAYYCCTVTDNNGCQETICFNITNITGIATIGNSSGISVYPDPNTGSFTIAGVVHGQTIELYNALGQLLSNSIADNTTMNFNISYRSDGLYLVRILNSDGTMVAEKKIMKAQ